MDKKVKIFSMSGMPVSGKSTVIKTMKQKLVENGYLEENIHVFSVGKRFRDYFNKVIDLASNIDNEEVVKQIAEDEDMKRIFTNPTYRKELEKTIAKLKSSGYDFKNHDIEKANNSEELAEIRGVIDNIVDNDMKELGKKILEEDNENEVWIMDSRLAFSNIPESFAVRLTVRDNIAAQRLLKDNTRGKEDSNYSSIEEAKQKIIERKKGEEERYKQVYDVDLSNSDNYNLIIDTSYANIDEIADTILTCEERYKQNKCFAKTWASPQVFLPMQGERDTLGKGFGDSISKGYTFEELMNSIKKDGYDPSQGIKVFEYNERLYIHEGHHRNFASAYIGKTLVPYEVIKLKDNSEKARAESLTNAILWGHEDFFDKKDENGKVIERFSYNHIYPGIHDELSKNDKGRWEWD